MKVLVLLLATSIVGAPDAPPEAVAEPQEVTSAVVPEVAAESPELTPEQIASLTGVRQGILTVMDLSEQGIITDAQATQGLERYVSKAKELVGRDVSATEILTLTTAEDTAAPVGELSALQKFAGFITFVNIMWVLAILLGVVCVSYLARGWVASLIVMFAMIPLVVWEALFLLVGLAVAGYGTTLSAEIAPYVGFTGCMLFAGGLGFVAYNHKIEKRIESLFLVLAAVSGLSAVLYGSSLIGFLAVVALMGAIGFSVAVLPLCYCVGFKDEDAVVRATTAAFFILLLFVGLTIGQNEVGVFGVFRTGSLWMGSFVGFLGLLIASSKWYRHESSGSYALMQLVTLVAGVAALLVGSIWQIPELQRIGGTFFVLWGLEKFIEIPVKSMKGYAYLGLCASGLLYGGFTVIKAYPEVLGPYFLF